MSDQVSQFLMNHPLLTAGWLALVGALAWTFRETARGGTRLTPAQATRLINSEDAVVVDVRPSGEFREGHIINAENVALADLDGQMKRLDKYKAHPIIMACRSGQQSTNAASVLRKAGFTKVYNLAGGIVAWQEASLPLSKQK